MKKTYTKPEIMFEDFSLSTSIALGCEIAAHHAQNQCPYVEEYFGEVIFTEKLVGICTVTVPDGYNGLCYHVPSASQNIFAS